MSEPYIISIPTPSLVVLIGASGSGKSTFAARHFAATEVVSSDRCRGLVCDSETDQSVHRQAFEVVHAIVRARLEIGKITVVDATNVQAESREPLVRLAHDADLFAVAIVLDVPARVCEARNRNRSDRDISRNAIMGQASRLRRSLEGLRREGFQSVHVLRQGDIDQVRIERRPLWTDRRADHGPFDIIGDVHGCMEELRELLDLLGYRENADGNRVHAEGRRAIFLGDLVDRGPDSVGVLKTAKTMCAAGSALCVPGNHDVKLLKKLNGAQVRVAHGLAATLAQIDAIADHDRSEFVKTTISFLDGLVSHYVLDEGKLVVAHAGMKREYQGRSSKRVREFALYGDTTGETDELGLPVRRDWALDYRGEAVVVYGHTPRAEAEWINGTINIDTGCAFGGKLSALRYPEREIVSVPARQTYAESKRPFLKAPGSPAADSVRGDYSLKIEDVTGKRAIQTRLMGLVTIRAEQSGPALEVLSRFTVDPRLLVYLPPTMAPCATARQGAYLEHPDEAFAQFRGEGVPVVVCQEKHMGSRAVVIVCRTDDVMTRRFGVEEPAAGIVLTRTGRRFFDDHKIERELLDRVRSAAETSGLWNELEADWMLLDAELMPWSSKAIGLLRDQYAPVASTGRLAISCTLNYIEQAKARGVDLGAWPAIYHERDEAIDRYSIACSRYCWKTEGIEGLKLAPFHLLAAGSKTRFDHNHLWHMQVLTKLVSADPELLVVTPRRRVDLFEPDEVKAATEWWVERTEAGMEGMVVKPLDFIVKGLKGIVQPAVKVRGREYLRIIYGPEYTLADNLERLRERSLGRKRSLAIREFALGVEALERFVAGEPLYRVHECVAGILALESEPVDSRL